MNERNIEMQLKTLALHTPSPRVSLTRLDEGLKKHRKTVTVLRGISAAAAAFILIVGAVLFATAAARNSVYSTVTLDSTAGITLNLNKEGEVVSVTAFDQSGRRALSGFENSDRDMNASVSRLIAHLISNGTLSEYDNTILATAESEDENTESALSTDISAAITAGYEENGFDGAVLTQTASQDKDIAHLAASHHVSAGKAQLMKELITADRTMSYQSLSTVSVNSLNLIADSIGLDYRDITAVGTSSTLGCISEDEATGIVLIDLGETASNVKISIRFDAKDGELIYRLNILVDEFSYSYRLVASSGEIVTVIKSGGGATQVIIDQRSSTARSADDTSAVPSSGSVTSPVNNADEHLTATETQDPTRAAGASPVAPTENTDDGLPASVSFTSRRPYLVSADLSAAAYNLLTLPDDSRELSVTERFNGICYQGTTESGGAFLDGEVAVICSTYQLENFLSDHPYAYAEDGSTFSANYDDDYFIQKALIVSAYRLRNMNYRFSVSGVYTYEDQLYVNLGMTTLDELPTTKYLAYDMGVYEINKSELSAETTLVLF